MNDMNTTTEADEAAKYRALLKATPVHGYLIVSRTDSDENAALKFSREIPMRSAPISSTTKTREEIAEFIDSSLCLDTKYQPLESKHGRYKYGRQDLRALMDFIFCGPPKSEREKVFGTTEIRKAQIYARE